MTFRQLFDPVSSTYTYLIADDGTHEAVLIDPVIEQAERDLALLREHGLTLKTTLETHVHADHITGAHALKQATRCQTAVSRQCSAQGYDRGLDDGEVVLFGREELVVIATPGHTPCSVSYLWRDRVFTGDALLIGGCGRTDFQAGSPEALYDSITGRLFGLDPQTLVYPGHDYKGRRVSSIAEEQQFNARVAGKSRDEFVTVMNGLNLPMPKRIHEAVPANLAGGPGLPEGVAPDALQAGGGPVLSVSARQCAQIAAAGPIALLDCRTPGEFAAQRIAGAVNVPFERLDPEALKSRFDPAQPVYCVCQTGTRSQIAASRLRKAGFQRVIHVDGGLHAWLAEGLPVLGGGPAGAGGAALPLERQVQLAAGALVLAGVLAGLFLHPAGYALAALVGAGLGYTGISGSCLLSDLMAHMPWNSAAAKE